MNFKIVAFTACTAFALVAGPAQAQESNLSVSLGVRAWHTQWTTWGTDSASIFQVPAKDKTVAIPVLNMRYKDVAASVSAMPETSYSFAIDSTTVVTQKRSELDATLAYYLAPGFAAGLGYKKFTQKDPGFTYELAGPTFTVAATAAVGGAFSIYGNLTAGSISATKASTVKADADYRLTEVGVAYSIGVGRFLKAVSLTGGYRVQVVNATGIALPLADATGTFRQDARDVTQGFTLGLVAAF